MRTFKAAIIYWRLAIGRAIGKAFITIVLSAAQALNGTEWGLMTATQKFVCIAIAVGQGWAIIDAFVDSTLSELQKHPEGLTIPEGSRAVQETQSSTTTTVEPTVRP